ncbi:unnamed protein product, partial [Larinioides sclopetarius]
RDVSGKLVKFIAGFGCQARRLHVPRPGGDTVVLNGSFPSCLGVKITIFCKKKNFWWKEFGANNKRLLMRGKSFE